MKTYLNGRFTKIGNPISYNEMKTLTDGVELPFISIDEQVKEALEKNVEEFLIFYLEDNGIDKEGNKAITMKNKLALKENGEYSFYDTELTEEHRTNSKK